MADIMCVILGGLTVLLIIFIIALAVKIKKLQRGTVHLEFVAHPHVHSVYMMERVKHIVKDNKQSRPLSFAI